MLIRLAIADEQIMQCFAVLRQLRPQLEPVSFLSQVQRQQKNGYQLAYLTRDRDVIGVAGFALNECLAWGRFLYVFDLVVDQKMRSQGAGQALMQWLIAWAQQHGCQQLHLDSGVQRFAAHRFYLQQRLQISSHHFSLDLAPATLPQP